MIKYLTKIQYCAKLGGDTVTLLLSGKSLDWYQRQPFYEGKYHLLNKITVLEEVSE